MLLQNGLYKSNPLFCRKKRFFVLQKDQLVYYRSLRDSVQDELFTDVQKPARVIILNESSKVVDYGLEGDYHQFSLFDHEKRVFWLAAEDNKVIEHA